MWLVGKPDDESAPSFLIPWYGTWYHKYQTRYLIHDTIHLVHVTHSEKFIKIKFEDQKFASGKFAKTCIMPNLWIWILPFLAKCQILFKFLHSFLSSKRVLFLFLPLRATLSYEVQIHSLNLASTVWDFLKKILFTSLGPFLLFFPQSASRGKSMFALPPPPLIGFVLP